MWEQIRANKRNSIVLLTTMAVVLMVLGFVLGLVFAGPDGGFFGLIIATVVWLILMAISFSSGDQILLMSCKAKLVTSDVHPQLFNVVEEMTIAANLPKMPKVYIINDPAPNAFATGRKPESASVAVFLRGMFYRSMMGGRSRRYSSSSGGGGQAQIIFLIIAVVCAILAPIFANILYFALSRKREYLADAGAVRLTRYPAGLAGALEKISKSDIKLTSANKVTAPMYISNPFKGLKAASLFSTHPPIDKRIKILKNMSRGASFKDYSDSYSQTVGAETVMPASALKETQTVEIRKASAKSKRSEKQQLRQIGDIMRQVNSFVFLTCACGVKMKIPPNFKANKVNCPRCGKTSSVNLKK